MTPCRLVDTRGAAGPRGAPALIANTDRPFTLVGGCNVPAEARSLALNVTVTLAPTPGSLTFTPASAVPIGSTTISYGTYQTRANNTIVGLGAGGDVLVHFTQPAAGGVHLIVDVSGYFR